MVELNTIKYSLENKLKFRTLTTVTNKGAKKKVMDAVNYALFSPGATSSPSRRRPLSLILANRWYDTNDKQVLGPAISIEYLHTASLIMDDLPAQDNSELRRGIPTVWHKYGEATAQLAAEYLSGESSAVFFEAARYFPNSIASANSWLRKATGIHGLLGGQAADLELEGRKEIEWQELESIYMDKTAKFIGACISLPSRLHEQIEDARIAMDLGTNLGMYLQILDDINSIDTKEDENRPTAPKILGMGESLKVMQAYLKSARSSLRELRQQDSEFGYVLENIIVQN